MLDGPQSVVLDQAENRLHAQKAVILQLLGRAAGSSQGRCTDEQPKKVVLAYSGGLDTSVILRWLIETYRCEVVAFCADLGQGEELIPVREKALRTGASAVHIVDLREEFVRDFVFPMLRANAVYEGALPARHLDRAAADRQGAGGGGPRGRAPTRWPTAPPARATTRCASSSPTRRSRPSSRVIAPWREWDLDSRTALIEYAERHDIPVPVTAERPYSTDRNLFHISYEGGILEDPWAEPPPKMFLLTQLAGGGARRADLRRDRVRGRRPGGGRRRRLAPGRAARAAEPARRRARRRPRRPGREPLRGHEVARRLRDAGRHHPARRAPGARVASRSTARCCTCATRWCRATPR